MTTNTNPTNMTKTTDSKCRITRLIAYCEMMATEEDKSGFTRNGRDLRALVRVLRAAKTDLPRVANVPEWGNHTCERTGKLAGLGTVAATYACWIEEGEEPVSEHDGACQLAEMAVAAQDILNALDALCFKGNR